MINLIKSLLIIIFFKLYLVLEFTIFLKIIEFIGGTIFIKIFQSFKNTSSLEDTYMADGTIGCIENNNNIITKKLHPNIKTKLINSFDILNNILYYSDIPFPFNFDEYYNFSMIQVNLNKEREYSLRLKDIFKNIKNVEVIDIFYSNNDYHLSKFIIGLPVDIFLDKHPMYKNELIKLLYLSYYLMLINNFFHCDWHFGNFLVTLNNENNVVLHILDTGLMGSIEDTEHFVKLKNLLTVNLLRPDPINIIKYLSFINRNSNADIIQFMNESIHFLNNNKHTNMIYKDIIIKIISNASMFKLELPVVILYMFQGIVFMDKLLVDYNETYKEIKEFSKTNGFYDEIEKTIHLQ
jgi:predicted unusual protein kinase regulating ubiquinone biosynthesis (AarF/ABC1/UbiB family)